MHYTSNWVGVVAMLIVIGLLMLLPAASAQDKTLGAAIATKGSSNGATACAICHGAKGEGNAAAGFPRLAGMNPTYIEEQLNNYADNKRQNAIMSPLAKQLIATERKAVSAYFGSLPKPVGVTVDNEETLKTSNIGAWLATRGRWDDDLPACVQCHGPGGTGIGAAFPAIAGQSSMYLAAQLHAFKRGTRPGGPMNLMAVIANKLSDADITEVANHFGAANTEPIATVQEKAKK